jgi:hypothetical protein
VSEGAGERLRGGFRVGDGGKEGGGEERGEERGEDKGEAISSSGIGGSSASAAMAASMST